MVEKMRRQSRLESVVIGVCLLTILGLSFFYLYLRSTFRGEAPQTGDGAHILMPVSYTHLFTRDAGDQLLMDRTAHSGKGLIIGLRHG